MMIRAVERIEPIDFQFEGGRPKESPAIVRTENAESEPVSAPA
jgi:hypothetical protein